MNNTREERPKAEALLDKLLNNESVSHMEMYRQRRQITYLIQNVERYREVEDEALLLIDLARGSL